MTPVQVRLKRLGHGRDIALPAYQTIGSAGADLQAAITTQVIINPGQRAIIPTGIAIALPSGFEAQVRPRSGLAAKSGITTLNSPGTIDQDYRGEIKVILINHGDADFTVLPAMRIAQLIIAPFVQAHWLETDQLTDTERGDGGFGSTGVHQSHPSRPET